MKRLYSLDALRGVAALSVVLWHWQHFYAISGSWQTGWQRTAQPLYWALRPFYDAGWAAVDLFFALSGFVFFWLYADAIAARAVGAAKFARLRFSRLYPLHTLTLFLVALMQILFYRATGKFFIYELNDWQHFVSSLFMAQQWLPPTIDQTFNGPAWSVSVEVLLYVIFFALMRARLKGLRLAFDMIAIGIFLLFVFNEMIGRGVAGFFVGAAVYYATERIKQRGDAKSIARWTAGFALLAWAVVVIDVYTGAIETALQPLANLLPAKFLPLYFAERPNILLVPFILVVSPLTLAALALHEQVLGGRYERVAFLGDISYSSYLLQFPMQLALALLALRLGWRPQTFQNGWMLLAFYAALIALASASYRLFERPLQSAIRKAKLPVLFPAE